MNTLQFNPRYRHLTRLLKPDENGFPHPPYADFAMTEPLSEISCIGLDVPGIIRAEPYGRASDAQVPDTTSEQQQRFGDIRAARIAAVEASDLPFTIITTYEGLENCGEHRAAQAMYMLELMQRGNNLRLLRRHTITQQIGSLTVSILLHPIHPQPHTGKVYPSSVYTFAPPHIEDFSSEPAVVDLHQKQHNQLRLLAAHEAQETYDHLKVLARHAA